MRLSYKLAHQVQELAPTRPMFKMAGETFERTYEEHLEAIGVETFHTRFAEIRAIVETDGGEPNAPLALLCFGRA